MKKVYGRQNISKDKLLFFLIIFILIIGFGTYSYARYLTSLSGNATTSVAAWNAIIKKNSQPTTTNLDLVLTPTTNTDVVSGKIAPGLSATGTYEIDFAGSEVSADYIVNFGTATNLPTGATLSITATETINGVSGTAQTVTVGNEYEGNFTLSEITTGTGAKVLFTVTVDWTNNESNNITDTTAGTTHNNITIPITITAKQRIQENIVYVVNSTPMYIGQPLPNGVRGRSTPAAAMADWLSVDVLPFYLKHELNENGEIEESYIEFIVTDEMAQANPGMLAGTYTINNNGEEDVEKIKKAFDYEQHPDRCGDLNEYFFCSMNYLEVGVSYERIYVEDVGYGICEMDKNNNYSICRNYRN